MPKPTNELPADRERAQEPTQADIDAANAALSSVIALKARKEKAGLADTGGTQREANGLVTVRAKPEKRLNAKDRAKARRTKGQPDAAEETAGVTPEVSGLSTAHPKPEKRKNAKERAQEKYAKDKTATKTEDGTTPDMTAKAKSKVDAKVETKADTKKANKKAK